MKRHGGRAHISKIYLSSVVERYTMGLCILAADKRAEGVLFSYGMTRRAANSTQGPKPMRIDKFQIMINCV